MSELFCLACNSKVAQTCGVCTSKAIAEKDKLIAELREGLGMVLEEYVIGASQMNEFKYKYSHLLEDKE